MRMEMFQILYEVWDNDDTFGTFGANLFSKYVFGMKHGTVADWLTEELQNLLDLLSASKKYLVKLQNKLLRLFVEL